MAVKKKTRKDGSIYYRFEVFKRRNSVTGAQEYYPSINFEREKGWSDKKFKKEADKAYAIYESDCKAGKVLSKQEIKDQERQIEIGKYTSKTFGEFANDDYMPYKKEYLEETSISCYEGAINRAKALNDIPLSQVSRRDIQLLVNDVYNRFSRSTADTTFLIVKDIFRYAQSLEIVEDLPTDKVAKPKPKKSEAVTKTEEQKRLSPSEYAAFVNCLDTEYPLYRVLLLLLADSGCRIGEIVALKWDAVHLEEGFIRIFRNAQYVPKKGNIIKAPKNNSVRDVYLTKDSLDAVEWWYENQIPQSEWVFPSPHDMDNHICRSTVAIHIKAIGKQIGRPDFHPHMVRHTSGSRWLDHGMPIQVVARRLGHRDISTTAKVYAHGSTERDKTAAEEWNVILSETDF